MNECWDGLTDRQWKDHVWMHGWSGKNLRNMGLPAGQAETTFATSGMKGPPSLLEVGNQRRRACTGLVVRAACAEVGLAGARLRLPAVEYSSERSGGLLGLLPRPCAAVLSGSSLDGV